MSGDAFPIATLPLDGGARIGICPLPGGGGAFDRDFMAILRWGPLCVVSMTEPDEMGEAVDLPRRLGDAGVAWRHFPVRDFGAPREIRATDWPALARELHLMLDRGGPVLLHCRGGLGRSGMVALRLLVERGEDADEALARIRQARPGAVETDAQFAWASAICD